MPNEISLDQDRIIDALVEQERYSFFGANGETLVTLEDEVGVYMYEEHGEDLHYVAELLVRIDLLEVPELKKKAEKDLAETLRKVTRLARERLIAVAKRIAEENS